MVVFFYIIIKWKQKQRQTERERDLILNKSQPLFTHHEKGNVTHFLWRHCYNNNVNQKANKFFRACHV